MHLYYIIPLLYEEKEYLHQVEIMYSVCILLLRNHSLIESRVVVSGYQQHHECLRSSYILSVEANIMPDLYSMSSNRLGEFSTFV